eukprot:TRINITY_DN2836_c0_g1_i1.p1 TRINITY_DN2836_c0_g1~~TRINITY_DN2836_c0_g1_i1.p1  ORF type:complete len:287 (-),score=54.30 TRINITY_DN2836_c0_g1_i1:587-1411(-)
MTEASLPPVPKTLPQAFPQRLFAIVDEAATNEAIKWLDDEAGGFVILDVAKFMPMCVARYFSHNKFCSFLRQLSNYNFVKVKGESGPRTGAPERYAFRHEHGLLVKGHPEKAKQIARRQSVKRAVAREPATTDLASAQKTIEDQAVRIRQLEGALATMTRELAALRANASASAPQAPAPLPLQLSTPVMTQLAADNSQHELVLSSAMSDDLSDLSNHAESDGAESSLTDLMNELFPDKHADKRPNVADTTNNYIFADMSDLHHTLGGQQPSLLQ